MGAGDQGVGCGVVRVRRREAERTLANKSSISQCQLRHQQPKQTRTRTQDVWSVRMLSWSAFPVAGESGSTAGARCALERGADKRAVPPLRHLETRGSLFCQLSPKRSNQATVGRRWRARRAAPPTRPRPPTRRTNPCASKCLGADRATIPALPACASLSVHVFFFFFFFFFVSVTQLDKDRF